MFAVLGQKIGEVIRGQIGIGPKVNTLVAAWDVFSVALDSFNPMGGGNSVLRTVVPTALKPLYEIETNKNFMDIPIMPGDPPFGVPSPDSAKFFRSVSPASKWFTKQLNEMTGGNAVRPGLVDVSPETLDHWVQFMTGATGAFAMRSSGTIYRALSGDGDDIRWNDIPFARRLIEGNGEYYTRRRYYEIRTSSRTAVKELKHFQSAKDGEGVREVRKEFDADLKIAGVFKGADKALRRLRKQRNAIEAKKDISDDAKKDRLEKIEERSRALMSRVILFYNRAVRAREAAKDRPAKKAAQ